MKVEEKMEKKIREILSEINEEAKSYNGENMIVDLGIDSHDIFNLVFELEQNFNIQIEPEQLRMNNFQSIKAIEKMIKEIMK